MKIIYELTKKIPCPKCHSNNAEVMYFPVGTDGNTTRLVKCHNYNCGYSGFVEVLKEKYKSLEEE